METLKNEFNLIDGKFKASETRELLSTLFLNKLRFHSVKNFTHQEKFGTTDAYVEKRIERLEATLEEVLQLLKSYDQEEEFEIYANVKIKPVNAEVGY
ncbi:MAG: hypothetical protein ACTHNW_17000 [Mucilaginibacter sp.]